MRFYRSQLGNWYNLRFSCLFILFLFILVAEIAGFQGDDYFIYPYLTPQETHTNDIAVRFKTFLKDALLFTTVSRNSNDFLRAELENGQAKVTVNFEGQAPQVRI